MVAVTHGQGLVSVERPAKHLAIDENVRSQQQQHQHHGRQNEVKELRDKVADCKDCYMHCIVEPSKVLGASSRNLKDLMEWVVTFRGSAFNV